MSSGDKMKNTVVRGIKTPIIKAHDNLVEIVTKSILEDAFNNNYNLHDKDIVGITEAVVSIAYNNYVSIDNIVSDVNSKFKENTLGIVFPILSRNRFSMLLKAFAKAKKELVMLISYPFDEVGNPILDEDKLKEINRSTFDEETYYKYYKDFKHPWTNINMIDYYKEVVLKEGSNVKFIFSNDPLEILKYTKQVLVSNVHDRVKTKNILKDQAVVYSLDELLTKSIDGSGFNLKYGLLGSNYSSLDLIKLFPNDNKEFLEEIQKSIYEKTNANVEVLIYGDGAFKDPFTNIWELCDPVVSPSYTKGLEGSPNEFKLKYVVENEFKNLTGEELEKAILKKKMSFSNQDSLGTTPRRYVDLIGTLCDLVSGSGDRSTPVVLIQNYFK